jgi:hypothetical protein
MVFLVLPRGRKDKLMTDKKQKDIDEELDKTLQDFVQEGPMDVLILSGIARVGKTSFRKVLADKLFEMGYLPTLVSFGDPIKEASAAIGFTKESDPERYRLWAQEYGDEMKKDNPLYFVDKLRAKAVKADKRIYIIDDCRFKEEASMFHESRTFKIFLSPKDRDKMEDPYGEWRKHNSELLAETTTADLNTVHENFDSLEIISHERGWQKIASTQADRVLKKFFMIREEQEVIRKMVLSGNVPDISFTGSMD